MAVLIAVTGGLAAPTLFVAFLWAPYLGMSVELGYRSEVLVSARRQRGRAGRLVLRDLGVALGDRACSSAPRSPSWLQSTYFYASDLYAERFTAEQLESSR